MVKPKETKTITQKMQDISEEYNRRSPIIETKWAVDEVTPGWEGFWDGDTGGKETAVTVSPKFDTIEEATAWMNDHVADKDKFLTVVKFEARQHTYVNWNKFRVRGNK